MSSLSFSHSTRLSTRPASLVKRDHYNSKFGADRVAAMIPQMEATGMKESPPIKFSYGGTLGNTLDSHRLIEWAYEMGGAAKQDALVENLFSRYVKAQFESSDRVADNGAHNPTPPPPKQVRKAQFESSSRSMCG